MTGEQFVELLNLHKQHRCHQKKDGDGNCRLCVNYGTWWAVTIRGGVTFVGESACSLRYTAKSPFFILENCGGDGLSASILIEEIVAIAESNGRPTHEVGSGDVASPTDLTSLRKEVGRLYGIIKDMEKAA